MAGFSRTVHPSSSFMWGSIDDFAPDLHIRLKKGDGEDAEEIIPEALALSDPDGEVHVFVFIPEGKQDLFAAMTGGIVVANGKHPLL